MYISLFITLILYRINKIDFAKIININIIKIYEDSFLKIYNKYTFINSYKVKLFLYLIIPIISIEIIRYLIYLFLGSIINIIFESFFIFYCLNFKKSFFNLNKENNLVIHDFFTNLFSPMVYTFIFGLKGLIFFIIIQNSKNIIISSSNILNNIYYFPSSLLILTLSLMSNFLPIFKIFKENIKAKDDYLYNIEKAIQYSIKNENSSKETLLNTLDRSLFFWMMIILIFSLI